MTYFKIGEAANRLRIFLLDCQVGQTSIRHDDMHSNIFPIEVGTMVSTSRLYILVSSILSASKSREEEKLSENFSCTQIIHTNILIHYKLQSSSLYTRPLHPHMRQRTGRACVREYPCSLERYIQMPFH